MMSVASADLGQLPEGLALVSTKKPRTRGVLMRAVREAAAQVRANPDILVAHEKDTGEKFYWRYGPLSNASGTYRCMKTIRTYGVHVDASIDDAYTAGEYVYFRVIPNELKGQA